MGLLPSVTTEAEECMGHRGPGAGTQVLASLGASPSSATCWLWP